MRHLRSFRLLNNSKKVIGKSMKRLKREKRTKIQKKGFKIIARIKHFMMCLMYFGPTITLLN